MGGRELVLALSGAPEPKAEDLLAGSFVFALAEVLVGTSGKERGSLDCSSSRFSFVLADALSWSAMVPACAVLKDLRGCLAPKMMLPRLEKDSWVIKSSSNKLSVGIVVEIIGEPWGSDAGDKMPLMDLGAERSCPFSG